MPPAVDSAPIQMEVRKPATQPLEAEIVDAPPVTSSPSSGDRTADAPGNADQAKLPPEPGQQPQAPQKRDATEAELEKILDSLRHKGLSLDLNEYYETFSKPAFTNSKNYEEHIAKLDKWKTERPDSASPLAVIGRAYILWAWEARGSGWANTVSEEGWKLFHERIAKAEEVLLQAIKLEPKDGDVFASLITVAMAKSDADDEARKWFEAGFKVDPKYYILHEKMAYNLMPRWGGERGDVEAFVSEVADRIPDDDGLEICGRMASCIHSMSGENDLIFQGKYDRSLLVRASEMAAKRTPDLNYFADFAAVCAWAAQDRKAALRIRPRIKKPEAKDRLWPDASTYADFIRWCDEEPIELDCKWTWGSLYSSSGIAFANDPRFIWCGSSYDGTAANLIDLEQGSSIGSIPGPPAQLLHFIVDNDAGWMMAGFDGKRYQGLMLWNLNDPAKPAGIPTTSSPRAIALHAASDQIAWVENNQVTIAKLTTGDKLGTIEAPNPAHDLLFSPDGKLLAVGSSHQIVYDTSTRQPAVELPHPSMKPRPDVFCERVLAIDPEGRILTIARELKVSPRQKVLLFAADGKSSETIIADLGETATAHSARLSSDGKLLAISVSSREHRKPVFAIEVWDMEKKERVKRFPGHETWLSTIAFSPDNKTLASIGYPVGLIKFWSLSPPSE